MTDVETKDLLESIAEAIVLEEIKLQIHEMDSATLLDRHPDYVEGLDSEQLEALERLLETAVAEVGVTFDDLL